jgi:ring-1,2-phenylacetyl-CoA epoxidase subunit PaaD
MVTTEATTERAWRILAGVSDPEIPVLSILDLGIVREVEVSADGRAVVVTLTPTYSGCPATEVITEGTRVALLASYDEVDVRIRRSPAWTTDWLSASGRDKLASFGIAPPNGRALLPLLTTDGPASCPHCGATDLEELSGFGSTPCKALWRCIECREPFDYFKVF